MKVQFQTLGGGTRVFDIDPKATYGATIGVNVFNADGTLWIPTEAGGTGVQITDWSLILNIPPNVTALANTSTTGLYSITGAGTSATRTITAVAGETTVSNGSGVAGNPTIGLADLADSGVGATPIKRIARDAKGRVSGTQNATTDDLPEGSNLYFTDKRARAATLFGPALPNTDVDPIKPGWAVCRWMGGYARADATIPGREEAVGIVGGDTDVPVGATITPQIEGLLTLTVAQWLDAVGTPGGLAPGRRYGLAVGGEISLDLPPTAVASVPVGAALTAEALHVRINRPVYL